MSFPQYPYCEQHDPCGQSPQTVLLFAFAEPQVPSVVTGAVEEGAVAEELWEVLVELEEMLEELWERQGPL